MHLINKDGTKVTKGQTVTSFRGEACEVLYTEEPLHEASTGRVYVRSLKDGWKQGFYPSVFGLTWVD